METMRRLYRGLNLFSGLMSKITLALGGSLIALCTAMLILQVLYRFIIVKIVSISMPFTEELARYALIWSVYLCIGVCLKEGSQASVNLVYDRLPYRPKLALYCLTRIMMAIFLVVALVYGVQVVENNAIFKSSTMRIPGWALYSAPVVGCATMLYEMVVEWLGVLCGEVEPFAPRKGTDEQAAD